jgi:predicted RNA-binding Zn-ribbon protein involved in translation (DUF1610 family)
MHKNHVYKGNTMNAIMPPVGLVPRFIRLEQRNTEIYEAMQRYAEAEKPVPLAWVLELGENNSQLLQERNNPIGTGNTVPTLPPERAPRFLSLTDNVGNVHLVQPTHIIHIYSMEGDAKVELGYTCIILSSGPAIYVNVSPDEVLEWLAAPTVQAPGPLVSIKAYHIQHKRCPECGAHTIEQTKVVTLGVLSASGEQCYESDFRDTNEAKCSRCGWKGIVHDLVYARRKT